MRWLFVVVLWLGWVFFFYPSPDATLDELYQQSYQELVETVQTVEALR